MVHFVLNIYDNFENLLTLHIIITRPTNYKLYQKKKESLNKNISDGYSVNDLKVPTVHTET